MSERQSREIIDAAAFKRLMAKDFDARPLPTEVYTERARARGNDALVRSFDKQERSK